MLDPAAHADIGSVITVSGRLPADELGVTLAHEHLMAVHQGPLVDTVDPESAFEEMVRVVRFGVRSVVDMTDIGLGRDPRAVLEVASRSRAQVVLGTGFYKDGWLPAWVHDLDVAGMTDLLVREIDRGRGRDRHPVRGHRRGRHKPQDRPRPRSVRSRRAPGRSDGRVSPSTSISTSVHSPGSTTTRWTSSRRKGRTCGAS